MLRIISKTLNSLHIVIPFSVRFSTSKTQHKPSLSLMDQEYFTPFNKQYTLEGLKLLQTHFETENKIDSHNLITLDSLSETPYSETHRVFDRSHKMFFAQKTIALDSINSWNQINLILKQYVHRDPKLAQVFSINYNEAEKEVKILSEFQKKSIGDYAYFRIKNQLSWTNEELKILTWQLIDQFEALRNFNAKADSINYMKMFFNKTNTLSLYDLSDFTDVSGTSTVLLGTKPEITTGPIIYSLVQLIDPYAPVHNAEEAKAYLKANHQDFLPELEKIFETVSDLSKIITETKYKEKLSNKIRDNVLNKPLILGSEREYDKFISEKLIDILKSKKLSNLEEDIACLYQGLELYEEAHEIFEKFLERSTSSKTYMQIADVYKDMSNIVQASKYFNSALEMEKSLPEADQLLLSKIYNGYGKVFSRKGQFQEALKTFQNAEKALKLSNNFSPGFANEIQRNIELTKDEVQIFSQNQILQPDLRNHNILINRKKTLLEKIQKWVGKILRNTFPKVVVGFVAMYFIFEAIEKVFGLNTDSGDQNEFSWKFEFNLKDDIPSQSMSSNSDKKENTIVFEYNSSKGQPVQIKQTSSPVIQKEVQNQAQVLNETPDEKESKKNGVGTFLALAFALAGAIGASL